MSELWSLVCQGVPDATGICSTLWKVRFLFFYYSFFPYILVIFFIFLGELDLFRENGARIFALGMWIPNMRVAYSHSIPTK